MCFYFFLIPLLILLVALFTSSLPIILPCVAIYIAYKIVCLLFFGENDISIVNKNEIQEKILPPPKFTSQDIRNMNPRDFEVFIANIFSDNGYSANVTPYTGDGGKDIVVKKNDKTCYVECKHWESAVGRPELQKLVGAAVGSDVSDLIFISTGGFNVNAINYAKSVNSNGNVHLDLWTMEDILKIANKKMRIEHRS